MHMVSWRSRITGYTCVNQLIVVQQANFAAWQGKG
jgi:hypothetical protein